MGLSIVALDIEHSERTTLVIVSKQFVLGAPTYTHEDACPLAQLVQTNIFLAVVPSEMHKVQGISKGVFVQNDTLVFIACLHLGPHLHITPSIIVSVIVNSVEHLIAAWVELLTFSARIDSTQLVS